MTYYNLNQNCHISGIKQHAYSLEDTFSSFKMYLYAVVLDSKFTYPSQWKNLSDFSNEQFFTSLEEMHKF